MVRTLAGIEVERNGRQKWRLIYIEEEMMRQEYLVKEMVGA